MTTNQLTWHQKPCKSKTMYSKYVAELWSYMPGRDPVSIGAITTGMSSLKNTGFHVFVVRNTSPPVCEHVHENFKDAIAIDPGGSIFETGFVLGTGDVRIKIFNEFGRR